ncbi:hypothetical protein J2785_000249 [Burkholderia ambifaria]|nr:hypothetical protein [Burkholderia ambifaria]
MQKPRVAVALPREVIGTSTLKAKQIEAGQ